MKRLNWIGRMVAAVAMIAALGGAAGCKEDQARRAGQEVRRVVNQAARKVRDIDAEKAGRDARDIADKAARTARSFWKGLTSR